MTSSIRDRLERGEKLLACIMVLPSADVAEIVATSGIDVAMIDHEHGAGGLRDFIAQDRAIRGSAMQAMVRTRAGDHAYTQRLLDSGAKAIVCPGVETALDAEAFVSACRYPPAGDRGAGTGVRAARWGQDSSYYDVAADELFLVAQVESAEAVENIDAICAVPGIDMILIGPRDLAASIGALNRFDDPELWRLVRHAEDRIRASGKAMSSSLHPGRTATEMFADGYDMILCGKDVDFLFKGATDAMTRARTPAAQSAAVGTLVSSGRHMPV